MIVVVVTFLFCGIFLCHMTVRNFGTVGTVLCRGTAAGTAPPPLTITCKTKTFCFYLFSILSNFSGKDTPTYLFLFFPFLFCMWPYPPISHFSCLKSGFSIIQHLKLTFYHVFSKGCVSVPACYLPHTHMLSCIFTTLLPLPRRLEEKTVLPSSGKDVLLT